MNASSLSPPRTALGVVLVVAVLVVIVLTLRGGGADTAAVTTDVAVHVGAITRATLHQYVTAYGYVQPEPAVAGKPPAQALLSPIVGGVLAEINCIEGRRVTRGSVLFRLDSRLAQVAVQKARQEVDFAEKEFQRQQELLPAAGTSQRTFQEAQQRLRDARSNLAAAETQLAYLQITAPLTGTVVRLNAVVGQYVDLNTVLAEVVDLNRLVIVADVPTREAAGVRSGQRVLIGADSAAVRGTLTIVGKDVNPRTGTYRVQGSIPPGRGFVPGQFTAVRIMTEERRDVLVVPEVSLVTHAGAGSWIALVEEDQAVRTPVTPGLHERGLVEVQGAGITEGQRIVLEETYSLPEATKIRIVER